MMDAYDRKNLRNQRNLRAPKMPISPHLFNHNNIYLC